MSTKSLGIAKQLKQILDARKANSEYRRLEPDLLRGLPDSELEEVGSYLVEKNGGAAAGAYSERYILDLATRHERQMTAAEEQLEKRVAAAAHLIEWDKILQVANRVKLSSEQIEYLRIIHDGKNQADVARICGVRRSTVSREMIAARRAFEGEQEWWILVVLAEAFHISEDEVRRICQRQYPDPV